MSIASFGADKFDDLMGWVEEGSTLWSFTKIMGLGTVVTAALFGIVASPFIYFADQNERSYDKLLASMKSGQALVFKSIDDCTAKGMPNAQCTASQSSAFSWANGLGTSVSYSSLQACSEVHGGDNCPAITTMISQTLIIGKAIIVNYVPITSYDPPVIAWQAAAYDLKQAVPLYPTAASNIAVRHDGAKVVLGGG